MKTLGARMDAGETIGFDYLRMILAVAVMIWHSFPLSYGSSLDATKIPLVAAVAVRIILPLFFSLSGFLVASSLIRTCSLLPFLISRGLRIGPALIIEVVLSALLLGPLLTRFTLIQYFSGKQFFLYFANVVGWIHYELPGVFLHNPYPSTVNGSLWTVPFELECYIALSFLFIISRWIKIHYLVIICIIIGMCFSLITWPPNMFDTIIAVPGRSLVTNFLAGVFIYLIRHRLPTSRRLILLSTSCTCILMIHPYLVAISPLFIAYCAAALGCTSPPANKILRSGDYSYGVYLYAFPMQQTTVYLFGGGRPLATFAISLLSVAIFAVFSWHMIEKPTLRLKNRLVKPRPVQEETAVEVAEQV